MSKKAIAVLIIILVALVGFMSYIGMNNEFHRITYAKQQLQDIYGIQFEISESSMASKPDKNGLYSFRMISEEGISSYGYCTALGKLVEDSYCHYFYSGDQVEYVNDILKGALSEYMIVKDCIAFVGNDAVTDKLNINDTKTYSNYASCPKESDACFRVYLREGTSRDELENAINILAPSGLILNIYFLELPDNLYDMQEQSNVICYYTGEVVSKELEKVSENIMQSEIDKLIYNPNSYVVAEYAPKLGKCEIR